MIFENKQNDEIIFSDTKLSLKRKALIGLLAVAVIGGGIHGYVQQKSVQPVSKSQTLKQMMAPMSQSDHCR